VQRHSIQFYDKINGKKIANEGAVFMPWECKTVEKQRLEFVTKALETNNFSALCREYEITRKTGRKWVDRFKQGLPLTDMSRRPLCSPNKTPDDIEELIVSVRFDNPGWGDDKIKIFGFNLFLNNRYVGTFNYLSNDNEYALKPTDRVFVSSDTMIESYQIMLKYIFNDCEQIKPLIDEFTNKEKAKKKYAELQLQIKAVKKEKGLTKIDEKNKILKLNEDYFTEPYVKMIEEYKKSCK
jgi:hypothetical protein